MQNSSGNVDVIDDGDDARAEAVARLWETQQLAVLASSDHGHAYTTLIFYAVADDCKTVVFFIARGSNTYNNLKSDGRASLLIDTREKIAEGFAHVEVLRASGVAWEIKNDKETAKLRDIYRAKNQEMAVFANDPNSALFKLTVSSLNYVVNYEELYSLGHSAPETD